VLISISFAGIRGARLHDGCGHCLLEVGTNEYKVGLDVLLHMFHFIAKERKSEHT
jgi:hypothetical protein